MPLRRRTLATATAMLAGLGAGPAFADQPRTTAPTPTRQQAFAQAAREFHVPERLLLAVSYLESRWDANRGQPSTSAGYGPMHLIDGAVALGGDGHVHDGEDPIGDAGRPAATPRPRTAATPRPPQTLQEAARLTGLKPSALRTDPAANIRGGAALLAKYQRDLGRPAGNDPAGWHAAVARYGGIASPSRWFADQVFTVLGAGATRTTDDGQRVRLAADPGVRAPARAAAEKDTECPPELDCEWVPAPYRQLDPNDETKYGNHDKANRPNAPKIDTIVIHDTETSYDQALKLVQDPAYLGWHYTLRSADGHVAQHVKAKDVGHHAGNWHVNSTSIGLEHEGFLARGGTWYTEAMYRSSAALVRYLAAKYDVPLDRGHIIGHDNVPARVQSTVREMHEDPGPYWDWAHYFTLLGRPLTGTRSALGVVMIRPDYDGNVVPYTGCDASRPSDPCPAHGGASIMLRTEPSDDAPLVKDVGKHPPDGTATMSVYDHSARAATGQTYAVADRRDDWTAIWYLGQKAWFHNPGSAPTAVGVPGLVVTPKKGAASVPVYGRPLPEPAAYPPNVPYQQVTPMEYTFAAGQKYALVGRVAGQYLYAKTFDPAKHVFVRGKTVYYEIQYGHRVYYVNAADVEVGPAR